MIGIIVTGHGNFATGLTSSVQLIAGNPEHYVAVDFLESNSSEDLANKINEAIDSLSDCDGILIFSDLLGGSPFKTAVEIKMARKEKIEVLSGTNLGMIIESSMARNFIEDVTTLANSTVSTGKDQVYCYEFTARKADESEDGI